MTDTDFMGRKHDIAYACFIPPGLVSLIGSIAAYVPMSTGTAGGIGLLVLVPLTMLALGTVPIGLYYSVLLRKDAALPLLSILTVLRFALIVTDVGPAWAYNLSGVAYGLVVVGLVAFWFLWRRRAFRIQ